MSRGEIFDEEGRIDITFTPMGERSEKVNALLVKSSFRQFVGTFKGTLCPDKGKKAFFDGIRGFTELHRAKW